jgi:hypothetical protein
MIFIPEQKLKSIIDYVLKVVNDDYNTQTDKQKSILYKLFGTQVLKDYNYYNNAVALFVRGVDSARKVECHLFFNRDRAAIPTVHIGLPSENPGSMDGVGFDAGVNISEYDVNGDKFKTSTRSFHAKYNIVCTSNNTFETLLIYNLLKSILIGNIHLFELNGLRNPKFSGGDIMLDDRLMPSEIYARAFFVDVDYETTSYDINSLDTSITSLEFEGDLTSEDDASLIALSVDGYDLTPDFNGLVFEYDVELAAGTTDYPIVRATAVTGATLGTPITGTFPSTIQRPVTSKSGLITNIYTINFTVAT